MAAAAIVVLATLGLLPAAVWQGAYPQANVRKALAFAATNERLEPYFLETAIGGSNDTTGETIGVIVTPFVRIVEAARRQQGGSLDVREAAAIAGDGRIYVAIRWHGDLPGYEAATPHMVATLRGGSDRRHDVQPIDTVSGEEARRRFGMPAAWHDSSLVEAFGSEVFSPGFDFEIYKTIDGPNGPDTRVQLRSARIPRAAFTAWEW